MMKLIIRWIFVIGFLWLLTYLQSFNMIHRNQNLFMIYLFIASGVIVLGIVLFRDGVMEEEGKGPEPEALALLKKLGTEEENQENK